MATLSSTSTQAEIEASYDDNASFEEDASPTKAALFLTAARMLLRRLIADSTRGANAIRFGRDSLTSEIARAQAYLASNVTANPTTVFADLRHYR